MWQIGYKFFSIIRDQMEGEYLLRGNKNWLGEQVFGNLNKVLSFDLCFSSFVSFNSLVDNETPHVIVRKEKQVVAHLNI